VPERIVLSFCPGQVCRFAEADGEGLDGQGAVPPPTCAGERPPLALRNRLACDQLGAKPCGGANGRGVPAGGGPPPHWHDFEEMFTLLEGELEFIFRGKTSTVRAGSTVNIPANAPHAFKNASSVCPDAVHGHAGRAG